VYIKYGGFTFGHGEATLSSIDVVTNHSARGFRQTQTVRFDIEGEVCAGISDSGDITTRLQQIETAFAFDGYDFGLFHDDHSPTVHYLESNHVNNLTGNQVLYTKYPGAYGGEYVNGRMFAIGVGAEMLSIETPLLQYHDSMRQIGNGGADARWRWHPRFRRWVVDVLAPRTAVTYVHSGFAETLGAWFEPPPPYYTNPLFLKSSNYELGREHPKRRRQGYLGRITTWRYVYELPVPDPLLYPILRMV
jgi:hypothetical protein